MKTSGGNKSRPGLQLNIFVHPAAGDPIPKPSFFRVWARIIMASPITSFSRPSRDLPASELTRLFRSSYTTPVALALDAPKVPQTSRRVSFWSEHGTSQVLAIVVVAVVSYIPKWPHLATPASYEIPFSQVHLCHLPFGTIDHCPVACHSLLDRIHIDDCLRFLLMFTHSY